MNGIVLPAFSEVEKYFGVKPVIVKISKPREHENDPFWWSYSKDTRIVMNNHIKIFKC